MIQPVSRECLIFLTACAVGFLCGIMYDFCRAPAEVFSESRAVRIVSDIVFWMCASAAAVTAMWNVSGFSIRAYEFAGMILGFWIYILTLSRPVLFILKKIIFFVKKVLLKLLTRYRNFSKIIFRVEKPLNNKNSGESNES